nr:MAG TPA: hypothetical protein [Caudoviricetes sp.]
MKTLESIAKEIQFNYGIIVLKDRELYYNNYPMWYDVYNILIGDSEISFLKIDDIYRVVDLEGTCYNYTNDIDMQYKITELIREVI